jgi:hypothetical protein
MRLLSQLLGGAKERHPHPTTREYDLWEKERKTTESEIGKTNPGRGQHLNLRQKYRRYYATHSVSPFQDDPKMEKLHRACSDLVIGGSSPTRDLMQALAPTVVENRKIVPPLKK